MRILTRLETARELDPVSDKLQQAVKTSLPAFNAEAKRVGAAEVTAK